MDYKDYYKILGVDKKATEKEIKAAYRRLARKHHPDVNPGNAKAEARFKEINEANEVLSEPEKRKRYDQLGVNWNAFSGAAPAGRGRAACVWTSRTSGAGGSRTSSRPSSAAPGRASLTSKRCCAEGGGGLDLPAATTSNTKSRSRSRK